MPRIILAIVLTLTIITPSVSAASAQFTNQNALFYTGTSSAPGTLYQDAIGSNADVGIELCDLGSRFVSAFYAMDVLGTFENVMVAYASSTNALGETTVNAGGGCFQTPAGFTTVSPSTLTTPNPDAFNAAFPGYLWVGYEASANPGSVSTFVFGNSSMSLSGSYSITRTFDQVGRTIDVSTPQIIFTTDSGSFSKSASDGSFGISTDRRMVMGVCDDQYGVSCSDGEVLISSSFPESYDTGLTAPQVNDQNIYTKYVVANSLGYDLCIGANLDPSITVVTPNPVYYSQNLSVTLLVANPRDTPFEQDGGNVDVTTDFDVNVVFYNTSNPSYVPYNQTFTVTNTIAPATSVQIDIEWPAFAFSGDYTILVTADSGNDITECAENDNTASSSFTLLPITLPTILIDGVETSTFPYANVPYNLTFSLKNSDNATLSDAFVEITEENGLSATAPTQIWNASNSSGGNEQRGLQVTTDVVFYTDINGNASFTFVPTYNPYYESAYSYLDVETHVGSYNLTFSGNQSDGQEFIFIIDSQPESIYPFIINDTSYPVGLTGKSLPNENIAAQALDFIYQSYSNFIYTILS